MKELTLQELKDIEFNILKMFDSFCKDNNITYYMSHGTLLGAVKYQKFIPWDDDVDLLIPREDYNRMISLFKDNDRYQLFAYEKNQEYRYPYAKLCDMSTRKVEHGYNNGVELGVDIDLFPLDAWNDNYEKAKQEVRHIRKNMMCLVLTKLKNPDSVNPIKRFIKGIVMFFCKMFGSEYFIKKVIKACYKGGRLNNCLGCKSWPIYGKREIIPAEVFSDTVEVEFEGEKFPAPIGFDVYLRSLYGDYEKDPPPEKQKTHHNYTAYQL